MSWHKTDQDEILSEGRPKRGKGRIRLILAVAVLAVAAWYFLGRSPAPPGPEEPSADRAATDAGPAVAPIRRGSEGDAAEDRPPPRDGERARALIAELRSDPDTGISRAYARAEAFRDAGHMADAYLLYFYAARQGHAVSAMALGTMADPELHAPGDSFLEEPDMAQAYKWYSIAAEQGDDGARERMAALERRAEAMAAEGNERARRLLLQWR